MRSILIFADYRCHPIWERFPEGGMDDFTAYDLPIPKDLARRVDEWGAWYESVFNEYIYPPDTQFESPEEEQRFIDAGYDLYFELRDALGEGYEVSHYPYGPRSGTGDGSSDAGG